jgi:hypothetical protein
MKPWIVLIFLIIVVLTLFMFFNKQKYEHFVTLPGGPDPSESKQVEEQSDVELERLKSISSDALFNVNNMNLKNMTSTQILNKVKEENERIRSGKVFGTAVDVNEVGVTNAAFKPPNTQEELLAAQKKRDLGVKFGGGYTDPNQKVRVRIPNKNDPAESNYYKSSQDPNRPLSKGIFYDMANQFTESQRSYFHDNADKAILVNPGLMGGSKMVDASGNMRVVTGNQIRDAKNMGSVSDALNQPDFAVPYTQNKDYNVYFREDANPFTQADLEFCRVVSHPSKIQRAARTTFGCGWWYMDDPNSTSFCALGRFREPLDQTISTKYPGGRWIWSIEEASRLEDIKRCKRVRMCAAMDAPGIKGQCGFCTELGHAIPVDANGKPKYPNATGGDCSENTVLEAVDCPRPQDLIAKLRDIQSRGGIPNEPEVDEDGNVITLTAAQRAARAAENGSGSVQYEEKALCDPVNGKLSVDCLMALATSLGLSEKGSIMRMLRKQEPPNDMDQAAIQFVTQKGNVPVPLAILGSGNITKDSAAASYASIMAATTAGSTKIVREAAKWLAVGTEDFDKCAFEPNESGPFPVDCLQREFRKSGCQLSGRAAPNDKTVAAYAGMAWSEIGEKFSDLYRKMTAQKIKIQDPAVIACLGTTLYRPPPEICDEPGINYKAYAYIPDFRLYGNNEMYGSNLENRSGTPRRVLLGSFTSKNGLISFSYPAWGTSYKTMLGNMLRKASPDDADVRTVLYKATTYANIRTEEELMVGSWWHQTGSYEVKINNITQPGKVLETWKDLSRTQWNIKLPGGRVKVQVVFKGLNRGESVGSPNFDYMKDNLPIFQLPTHSWKPFVALDFFRGTARDYSDSIRLGRPNASYGYYDPPTPIEEREGRKCLVISPTLRNNPIWLKDAIMWSQTRTMTCMFNIYDKGQYASELFKFMGFSGYGTPTRKYFGIASAFEGRNDSSITVDFYNDVYGRDGGYFWYNVPEFVGEDPRDRWVHMAFVVEEDRQTVSLYINGKFRKRQSSGKSSNMEAYFTDAYLGGRDFNGAIAWFHIYDRALTLDEIDRDMNYDNPKYKTELDRAEDVKLTEAERPFNLKYGSDSLERPLGRGMGGINDPIECGQRCDNDPRCTSFTHDKRWGGICSLNRYSVGGDARVNENLADIYWTSGTIIGRKPDKQGACPSGMFEYGTHFGQSGKGFCCPTQPTRSSGYAADLDTCGDGNAPTTCSLDPAADHDRGGRKPLCPGVR